MSGLNMMARSVFGALAMLMVVSAQAAGKPKSLPESIDNYLSARFDPRSPGAAVVVVKDGKVIFRKGYGMADLELKVPVRPEMVFRLASVTKQFTAVAVLMLAEEGKLALGDEIQRFIPDYPRGAAPVTIERMLNHTSGIPGFSEEYLSKRDMRAEITPAQMLEIIRQQPPEFVAGTKWAYSDGAYELLGMIIEKASGMSYADFVEQRMFKPLGMAHSYYDRSERVIEGRVKGYARTRKGYQNAAFISMSLPYAAGSLASSVDDLALWDAAIADSDKLINAETRRRMQTSYTLADGAAARIPYGLGVSLAPRRGEPRVGHNGQINGFMTAVLRMPKERVYVAVLGNVENMLVIPELLAERVGAIAAGKPYLEEAAVVVPDAVLERYVGAYRINPKNVRNVSRDGKRLFMQRNGGPLIELHAKSHTEFFVKDAFNEVSFGTDAAGMVSTLTMSQVYGPPNVAMKEVRLEPAAASAN
ncbi:serine hydrolase [Massilia glaciei]|nr:serine hydrolase [Massilia glaciei]